MTFNMSVHIYFMMRASCKDCCKKCKSKKATESSKKKQEKPTQTVLVGGKKTKEKPKPYVDLAEKSKQLEMSQISEADEEIEDENSVELIVAKKDQSLLIEARTQKINDSKVIKPKVLQVSKGNSDKINLDFFLDQKQQKPSQMVNAVIKNKASGSKSLDISIDFDSSV